MSISVNDISMTVYMHSDQNLDPVSTADFFFCMYVDAIQGNAYTFGTFYCESTLITFPM